MLRKPHWKTAPGLDHLASCLGNRWEAGNIDVRSVSSRLTVKAFSNSERLKPSRFPHFYFWRLQSDSGGFSWIIKRDFSWYPTFQRLFLQSVISVPSHWTRKPLPTSPLQLGLSRRRPLSPFSTAAHTQRATQLHDVFLCVSPCSWWKLWISPTNTCWPWGRASTTAPTPTWSVSKTTTVTIRRRPSVYTTSLEKVRTLSVMIKHSLVKLIFTLKPVSVHFF